MKKNNTAEKAILEAEQTAKAIKENTEKSLKALMAEAINSLVMESEDMPEDEDSYEEEDVDTEDAPVTSDVDSAAGDVAELGDEGSEEDAEAEDAEVETDGDDEWSDMEEYKVGDNDYDFTGVDGAKVLTVLNKLDNDDEIFVQKNEDGDYEFKDDKTGAEYVIELDSDALDADAEGDDEFEFDGEEDDFGSDEQDDELEFEFDDEESDFDADDEDVELGSEGDDEDFEIEADGEDDSEFDDEEESLNEENLGYTDSYQKDVFAKKFNMKEPADAKTTKKWDKGIPDSAEKPWAGKGNMKPFDKVVKEEEMPAVEPDAEEANLEENGSGKNAKKHMAKGMTGINNQVGTDTYHEESKAKMQESLSKIINKAKQIQAINEEYAKVVKQLKSSLMEAAVSNVTLANMNKILTECTMTVEERKNLAERFLNVKTINESRVMYETVKRELNETAKSAPIFERSMKAESSKVLNETIVYQTPENNASLSLMERMDNLFKN